MNGQNKDTYLIRIDNKKLIDKPKQNGRKGNMATNPKIKRLRSK